MGHWLHEKAPPATTTKWWWPYVNIGITDSENFERQLVKNHSGAREFLDQIDEYIARESGEGTLLGQFKTTPFRSPMEVPPPLNITEKRDSSERRVIMDLSFLPGTIGQWQNLQGYLPGGGYKSEVPVSRCPDKVGEREATRLCSDEMWFKKGIQTDIRGSQRMELFRAALARKIVFWCDNAYGSEVGGNMLPEAP